MIDLFSVAREPKRQRAKLQRGPAMNGGTSTANVRSSEPTRRDFLYVATTAAGAIGAASTLIPLIDQMNPDASTIATGGPIDLDLTNIQPGQEVVVRWRDRPIFVVHRTARMLQTLQDRKLVSQLADPQSAELQQPPYADNWCRSIKPDYGVILGICTHLGCIPKFEPLPNATAPASNWLGGYFCPCHGSKYDLAGRVFSGVPAPYNLPIPPYHFVNDKTIRIGENPPHLNFDFSSIRQL
jgi:ubiquinol-cytochrome c reductase iron-sulfur subunit